MKLEVRQVRPKAQTTAITFRVDDKDGSGVCEDLTVKIPTEQSMDGTIASAYEHLASFASALGEAARQHLK